MAHQASGLSRPRSLRLFAGFLACLLTVTSAFAAEVKFDIPAQPAPAAIQVFIKQANVQVTYRYDDLKDVRANEVKGVMEPADALAKLIEGIGLEAAKTSGGNFALKKSAAPATTGSVKGSLTGEGGKGLPDVLVTIKETAQSAETDRYGVFAFPNVATGTYVLVASAPGYQTMHIKDVNVKAGRDLTIGKEEMRKLGEGVLALEPFEVHADTVEQLEKFIVTDTKPQPFSDRNVDLPRTANDVQPYYIFDSRAIEESNTTSVEDFLKQRLTMNATVQTNNQVTPASRRPQRSATGLIASTASSINLRGLGADHTLILVNGMRMAGVSLFDGTVSSASAGQPDVNGIPLSAIDRIEVLPSSAGAIYGSNAEGGVINIILKRAYNGGDITATYASTWDGYGPSRTISASFGKSFEGGKTQIFVTAQYSDATPMVVGDRLGLIERGYATLLKNDPVYINPFSGFGKYGFLGSTPNVVSIQGNLTLVSTGQLLGATYTNIPAGTSSSTSSATLAAGLIQNAGQLNLTPPPTNQAPSGTLLPLANYPRRKSVMATLTRQMTPNFQLHLDFSDTENHSFASFNTISQGSGGGPEASFFSVYAGVPVNPFNQWVVLTFPDNTKSSITADSGTKTITLGGTLKLSHAWVAHFDYQFTSSSYRYASPNILVPYQFIFPYSASPTFGNVTVQQNGVSTTVNDPNVTPLWSGAINPFVDTLVHPIDWSPFTYGYKASGKTQLNDLVLAASGPLFHLPWGDPRLSVRLEHDDNEAPAGAIASYAPTATPFPGLPFGEWYTSHSYRQDQTTDTATAQLDAPLFKSRLPMFRALDAQFNFSYQATSIVAGSPGYIVRDDNNYAWYSGPASGPLNPLDASSNPYRYKVKNSNTSFTGPALSYKPFDDVIIRASIADGFVPPTYTQLLPNVTPDGFNPTINDPKTNTSYAVQTFSGGNPHLKPQTSRSWNIGAIWEPQKGTLRGLRADIEYNKTEQHNLIFAAGTQYLVTNEAQFPGLVVRNPTSGLITTVYNQPVNLNFAQNEAWDLTLDYRWATVYGDFSLTAAETINEHVTQQIKVGGPLVEYVGFPNSGGIAKTKSTATLRWAFRNWVAAWTAVYFGGYNQYYAPGDPSYGGNPYGFGTASSPSFVTTYTAAQGGNTIPSQTYHNLFLSYTFRKDPFDRSSSLGRWSDAFLRGVKINIGVNNVFNTVPPFDAYYRPFYTSPYGDIQLRNYSVTLKKSF